jgi:hypothetical protein
VNKLEQQAFSSDGQITQAQFTAPRIIRGCQSLQEVESIEPEEQYSLFIGLV